MPEFGFLVESTNIENTILIQNCPVMSQMLRQME